VITCVEPELPAGSYVVGYDFNVHSTIEYHCEVGHILRGEATHECTVQGEWSGETPRCECKFAAGHGSGRFVNDANKQYYSSVKITTSDNNTNDNVKSNKKNVSIYTNIF
jgi:hypothetical protein